MQSQTKESVIEISDVHFRYPGKSAADVIRIPQWQVQKNERLFIYGPSGSGKSTLLNLLAGILQPQQGQITLLGQTFSALNNHRRDMFRARHLGMVFQQFNLIPYLSVLDNIQLAAHFGDSKAETVNIRLQALFSGLQLDLQLLSRRADKLSVGQQQRAAIARALINHPEILIVDEPTSALDSDARQGFLSLLLDLVEENQSTLLFVSHDRSLAHNFSRQIDMQMLNRVEASLS
ncbi:ABC transporter ATP-binding protein [Methylophaga sp. OBS4]|uniref:ABC transporter ATP-binding protein n=1 Tax=Methylophaga sp. OBS4 TaxID=2991935 RepID=UPI002250EAC8|nr:ABC transporter ATP-binding protein [Methylophaga sp. OBS4]MCX4186969.1 ABC transporter ATP-binding protein [Methylophaga sp. OBS4]